MHVVPAAAPAPFNFERALRITAPLEPHINADGLSLRRPQLLPFEERHAELDTEPRQAMSWGPMQHATSRLCAVDSLLLRRAAYSVLDGGTGLLLTYVLRHSAGGLRWRNSHGESTRLQPGAAFISQARDDSLVELSPSSRDEPCECLRVMLRSDHPLALALQLGPDAVPFCNSADACVRVMLGSHHDHRAGILPAPQLTMLDVDLVPLAELEMPVAVHCWALAIVTSGSIQHQGRVAESLCAVAYLGQEPLARIATQTGASFLWLQIPYTSPASLRSSLPSGSRQGLEPGRKD